MFEHYSVADLFAKLYLLSLLYHLQLKQLGIKTLSKIQQVIQLILSIKSLLQKSRPKRF